jgi:hypothetical protein
LATHPSLSGKPELKLSQATTIGGLFGLVIAVGLAALSFAFR